MNCVIQVQTSDGAEERTMTRHITIEDIPLPDIATTAHAKVSKTVSLSTSFSSEKVSTTVTLTCPQTSEYVQLADEIAYAIAKDSTVRHLTDLLNDPGARVNKE